MANSLLETLQPFFLIAQNGCRCTKQTTSTPAPCSLLQPLSPLQPRRPTQLIALPSRRGDARAHDCEKFGKQADETLVGPVGSREPLRLQQRLRLWPASARPSAVCYPCTDDLWLGEPNEAAGVHYVPGRRGGVATGSARAAGKSPDH